MRAAFVLVLVSSACADLDDFSTRQDEVWRGPIVEATFVRRGFDDLPTMDLAPLDLSNATSGPGRVTTTDGTFADAALLPIAALPHDALGDLNFGVGRLKSYLFLVEVSGGSRAGEMALAVLSLLEDDSVELRIILGTGLDPGSDDLYGIFRLTKQKRTDGLVLTIPGVPDAPRQPSERTRIHSAGASDPRRRPQVGRSRGGVEARGARGV